MDIEKVKSHIFTHTGFNINRMNWVKKQYDQPHRFFHNWIHVEDLIRDIDNDKVNRNWTDMELSYLYLTAIFHDIVYVPGAKDNEEKSAECFEIMISEYEHDKWVTIESGVLKSVKSMILATKYHRPSEVEPILSSIFNDLDMSSVYTDNWYDIEMNMFKEFQKMPIHKYKEGRIDFLSKLGENVDQSRINFVKNFCPRIGVFAGTFNKFHCGHLNVLEKAERMFDKVIVLCAVNHSKNTNHEEIVQQVKSVLPFHEVVGWSGLLTDYVKQLEMDNCCNVNITIIKGIRDDHDVPSELTQYRFLQDLHRNISVAYIPCDREFEHVSSSALKGLNTFMKDADNKYLPTKYSYYKEPK